MNRREFLQSLLAFGVAVALPLELATASGASTFDIDTASDAEVDAILDSGAYDFVVSGWGSISFADFAEPASREVIASSVIPSYTTVNVLSIITHLPM